ncbi:hypothetical protein GDO81_007995 [Engystomops pustulosus]|uniref:Secreted protein n=1 Tax=Engystomops pustulosus TaxID=76066 RepID=A0AAV7CBD0_ENGPU|nr:hypothetical protein GDO81_007995 [Engystomops pustulosus]
MYYINVFISFSYNSPSAHPVTCTILFIYCACLTSLAMTLCHWWAGYRPAHCDSYDGGPEAVCIEPFSAQSDSTSNALALKLRTSV